MKNFSIAKSRRLRSTPYTTRIEKQGVTAYTIYNHMLLPAAFGSIEDDINLIEKVHNLGCRFMQLTYNNQSLLATGCYEKIDLVPACFVGCIIAGLWPYDYD